jgi:hypothetical protein
MTPYILHLAGLFGAFALVCWLVFTPGRRPSRHELAVGLVIAGAVTFVVAPAWAADTADSHVTIPIGDIIGELAVPLFAAIAGAVAWLIRKLPAAAKAWIDTLRVEQLLDKAIAYGLNSVAGAAKGKAIGVDVHLPVLAYVLQYALDRIPAALLKWVGGPTSLAEMIWSRLDVETRATRPDLETLASEIAAGTSVAVAVATAKTGGAS